MSYVAPIFIDSLGEATLLPRVRIEQKDLTNSFQEAWLQELLFQHPEAIPFVEVDSALINVIPVCREMPTPAGPIDLVFVTPTGKIVLVETKLYRNPEARRAVIGQILDYAKELTSWRFEQFAARVASATKGGASYLLDLVRSRCEGFEDAIFVDSVNRSLSRADMSVLIVGDGISTGAEALVEFLNKHAGLQFSFGLVEVAVYSGPGGGRYVQPRILAKTEILRRTLLVSTDGQPVEEISDTSADEEVIGLDSGQTWRLSFWTEFVQRLELDDVSQPIPPAIPRGTNIFYPMPPSGSYAWVSAFIASSQHQVGVYLVLSGKFEPFRQLFAELQKDREAIEGEIGMRLDWRSGKSFSVTARRDYKSLDDRAEREAIIEFMTAATNSFVNAFRPRLSALLRDASLFGQTEGE